MYLLSLKIVFLIIGFTGALPAGEKQPENSESPRQIIYVAAEPGDQHKFERQQQYAPPTPDLNYLGLLEHQYQIPGNYFVQDKQPYPRIQPQILVYGPGGHGGQPFLLQPGSPPGNFLVPHPGPNVIYREQPQQPPQRPVFVAGYPKPAHIPPIEKDAEEIPTNPAKIPPLKGDRKPEKLETLDDDDKEYQPKNKPNENPEVANRYPLNPKFNLRPGQRFFILNGEPLFLNYPYTAPQNLKYGQQLPFDIPQHHNPDFLQKAEHDFNHAPVQSLLLRNAVTGQISDVAPQQFESQPQYSSKYSANVASLNQPREAYFRSSLPLHVAEGKEEISPELQFRLADSNDGYFQYQGDDFENDAIIIDAKVEDGTTDNESEAISTPTKQPEPSISQAQPGAIALAGPGGVAGAAPRGTALVGKGGLAVSSPQATAVAGPSKTESATEKSKKSTKNK